MQPSVSMQMGGDGGREVRPGAIGGPAGRASGRELRDFATQQVRIAHDQLDAFDAALAQHRVVREQLEIELEQSWSDLLEILLPSLEGTSLAQAAVRLAVPEMDSTGIARQSQARRSALAAALAELDRDPAVRQAADACAALGERRTNIDNLLGPLSETLSRLEAEPHFFALLDVKYHSSEYRYRFWHRATYRHWRQAKRILERHGERLGARRFGELYKHYLHEKEAVRRLSHARDLVIARAAELEARVRRRQEIEAELGSLPSWALAFARAQLRQHLADLAGEERAQLFGDDPALLASDRRVVSQEARLRQLEQARAECLDRPRAEVERALVKLLGVLSELLGPARKLDAVHRRDEIERDYGLPLARWRELRSQHDQQLRELQPSRDAGSARASS